jgi:regulatory protein
VPPDAGLERALALAYRYLNRRERTETEVRARLERADGVEPSDAEQAIAILLEQGYLDDARFARLFVQDKRELDQWGSDRIRQALRARGVPSELVEDALTAHAGEIEIGKGSERGLDHALGSGSEREIDRALGSGSEREIDRALAVLRRRFPSPISDRRERERAFGVLVRKGYDTDLALDAIAAHRSANQGDRAEY